MDELVRWTNGALSAALGRALLHSLWQGAALAALVALVSGKMGARARYGAACVALLALLLSFGITTAACYQTPFAVTAPPAGGVVAGPLPVLVEAARASVDWTIWLAPMWAAGMMLMSLRLAVAWLGARRLVWLSGPPLAERWQETARELASRLGVRARFRLLESARVGDPAVVGWLRPAILVPAAALCRLSPEQMEAVLAHELAHLVRRDALMNLLASLAEVALFYHPAAWWLLARIRRERENCCDDLAVAACGSARLYAEALLRLEEARPGLRAGVLAAREGDLIARVRRLIQPRNGECLEWRAVLSSLVALVVVAAAATAVTASQNQLPAPPQPPAAPETPVRVTQAAPQAARVYQRWLEQDAAYIIQDWEPRQAASLTSGEEWENFIVAFWDRRNSRPGSGENLFKEEHYRRIAHANESFGEASVPGWRTARGRIYICYGPPDEILSHRGYEKWSYRDIPGVGRNVSFEFGLGLIDARETEEELQERLAAQQEQLVMMRFSLEKLQSMSAEESIRVLGNLENVRKTLRLHTAEIDRLEAEIERLKAEQQAAKRR